MQTGSHLISGDRVIGHHPYGFMNGTGAPENISPRRNLLFVSTSAFRYIPQRRSDQWESVSASKFHGPGHRRRRNTRNRSG